MASERDLYVNVTKNGSRDGFEQLEERLSTPSARQQQDEDAEYTSVLYPRPLEVMSPTSSSSNGSGSEFYSTDVGHEMKRGEGAIRTSAAAGPTSATATETDSDAEERRSDADKNKDHVIRAMSAAEEKRETGDVDADDEECKGLGEAVTAEEREQDRFKLAIALDFETDTNDVVPVGGGTGSVESGSNGGTPTTFYPIYENEAFRFTHASVSNCGYGSYDAIDRIPSAYTASPARSNRSGNSPTMLRLDNYGYNGGRITPTFQLTQPADESQPLIGDIYPVPGEVVRLRVDNAAYIIFYKSDDSGEELSSKHEILAMSSSSEDDNDVGEWGRGLFRASTSVGSAFLKGAAGLVNKTYQGGASGGVFGFAKGLGMGMLGLALSTKDAMEIPLASILSAESSTTAPHVANIEGKHLLRASLAFQDETTCSDFLSCIWDLYSTGGSPPHYLFAHLHYQALRHKEDIRTVDGTGLETPNDPIYDAEEDYRRLKLLDEESWMRLYDNSDYTMFPSYPATFVVPSVLDEDDLRELSAYRLSGYVVEADQKMVSALQHATSAYGDAKFHFFDARSQMAAAANSAQGKGTEDPRNYPNSELHFCDIANIHAVRSSYASLAAVCQPGQERNLPLTGMVQLLLDPYYRTVRGFVSLVEKEWCSFGHMFRNRYSQGEGPGQQELEEQSPVFVQWLDALWQIWRQQSWAFEFNEAFLSALYEHIFSGLYGNFLYNNERQRKQEEANAPTRSLWFVLLGQMDKYVNVEYDCAKNFNSIGLVLPFSSEENDLVMWENHLIYADPVCRKYE
uniref:Myotubularin phosphatase domain-containing protein n=1 Tax=Phytophthora ramorum TaxID=164328 RepID=H3HCJ5_PHYRM